VKCTVKSKKQPPKLRHHKASGQAYAVISGKAVYFGLFGSTEATQKYHQVIAEWLAAGKQVSEPQNEITVGEIVARFWHHAQRYYVRADGTPTYEVSNFRQALRPLQLLYGGTHAAEFGPRALVAVHKTMIDKGWCRSNINKMIGRIKLMFRWATEKEFIGASVYHGLQTVKGLPKGRSEARETEPITPVPQKYIEAVEPYVSRQVWALVQIQLLTAARSGELVILRPCDIDMSGRIWVYTPTQHKTAHHGHGRKIYIGPRGQEILRPFLLRSLKAYCFSPAEAMAEWRDKAFINRKTPLPQGNRAGTNVKDMPERQPGKHYTPTGLGHTIAKAIKKAFRPEGMSDKEFKKWKPPQYWHPHQLRHNAATFLRKKFGLETARIILGHRSAVITEVYAEMDQQKAMEAIVRVG
jgi:integrase